MNETEKEARINADEQKRTNRDDIRYSGTVDFEREFKQSFSKAMYYEKMVATALEFLNTINPTTTLSPMLEKFENKDLKESITNDVIEWLEVWRSTIKECKTLPVDILGMASDMAKKDRRRLNEQK